MADFIVGNDISQFQNQIDWDKYKNNSNFVIIRSTFGNGYYDQWFARNRDEARRVGLPVGFYHYCYPQLNSAKAEAEWFCKALYDLKEGETLYLDFEENYTGDAVAWCKEFLDYVSSNFNGMKPMIYLNQALVKKYDWSPVVNAGYGLWLASYQEDGVGEIGKWKFMAMQQTSSSQIVTGIQGNVDRDVFFGTADILKKYGYKKPVPVPTPTPEPVPPVSTPHPVVPQPPEPPVTPPVQPIPDYKTALLNIKPVASKFHWFYSGDFKKIVAEITKVGL